MRHGVAKRVVVRKTTKAVCVKVNLTQTAFVNIKKDS